VEEALTSPRHIEVQVLADGAGDVVPLYERDCSVQRRHQKVLEMAPAPNLDPGLRDRLCEDAVRFARQVDYRNAGTVEFLVEGGGPDARYAFIEMNPRIQVEHTVTEETTDIDLVHAQLRIAGGETLSDLGLDQGSIRQRGVALQCRVTTEDPAQDFRPDTGRISVYRQPGGAGIRLDGGTAYAGAEVSPYFDSLLVKLTARGQDLPSAARRARRALAEFRIRGVATNTTFLRAVLADEDFLAGRATTSFIDERPRLTAAATGRDRATRPHVDSVLRSSMCASVSARERGRLRAAHVAVPPVCVLATTRSTPPRVSPGRRNGPVRRAATRRPPEHVPRIRTLCGLPRAWRTLPNQRANAGPDQSCDWRPTWP